MTGLGWPLWPAWPISVFAVDDTSVQLTWRASPPEGLRIELGDQVVEVPATPKVPMVLDRAGAERYRRAAGAAPTSRAGTAPAGTAGANDQPAATEPARLRLVNRYRNGWRHLDRRWPGGPGALTVEGLRPGCTYEIVASAKGVPPYRAGSATTLARPPGRELARFATVSDIHIGEHHFGVAGRLFDVHYLGLPEEEALTYPYRALEAALAEAGAWGPEVVVVKGDLTRRTTPAELRDVALLLAGSPVPVEVLMGNHDYAFARVNARGVLASQNVNVPWSPRRRDIAGARLVLVDSVHADPGRHEGYLPREAGRQVAELVASSPGCAWVGLHHPPEMHPYRTVYPPGIAYADSRYLLDALVATGVPTMVSAGHRHRNRRYRYGPVELTEVGSTKDYPGVWAGYKVFEGGMIQVVRRIGRPDVIGWTEQTRRAVNGQWGRWSPGRLEDRCFAMTWEH